MNSTQDVFRRTPLREPIERLELTVVDVGARGGIDEDLLPIAWATRGFGFEPEETECRRLNSSRRSPWKNLQFIPAAVGSECGRATLFIPANPAGASLRRQSESLVAEFGYADLHRTVREVSVETVTLDEALVAVGSPVVDYLKIDVEGIEAEILRASPRTIGSLSALKVEVSFVEQREGQALAWDVAQCLLAHGFILAEIRDVHSWRRGPLPCHPFLPSAGAGYSRGRAAQCDLVFLRRADMTPPNAAVRLAVICAVLGFFDYASGVLARFPVEAAALSDSCGLPASEALVRVSRSIGRRQAVSELARQLRSLVPLVRSAFWTGIPSAGSSQP